jgi:hypothetical protein
MRTIEMKNSRCHENFFLTRTRRAKHVSQISRFALIKLALVALLTCAALPRPALADSHDGTGTMTVSPTTVTASSTGNSFTFSFLEGSPGNFPNNSVFTITVPSGWTAPQTTSSSSAGYVSTTVVGSDTVSSTVVSGTGPWTIAVTFKGHDTTSGFNVTYAGGGTKVTAPSSAGVNTFTTSSKGGPGGTLTAIGISPTITVTGPLDHFAISPSTISSATVGTAFTITTITAQDSGNNTVTSFGGTVTFGGTAGVTGTSGSFVSGVFNASVIPTTAGGSLTVTVSDGSGHTGSATITTVNKGTPIISTSPTASAINYGQALSASTLSGGAATNAAGQSVSGSFAFTSPSTIPNAGTANQAITFTPASTANFNTPSAINVSVTVNPLAVQLSGSRLYDGTTTANSSILSIVNNIDGGNLTLSGSGILAGRNVGSQSISAVSALTRVQSTTGSTAGSAASSFGVTVSAPANGNTLVAVISTRGISSNRVSSISQTGATWTKASEAVNASGETTEIWYAPNISGAGTTVTINLAASLFASAVVAEYTGILSASPVDKTATDTGTSTTPDTGTTATTTQGAELWLGGTGLPNSSYTLGSIQNSFTAFANVQSSGGIATNNANVYALEKIVNSTGTASSGGIISGAIQTITQRGSTTTANSTGTTITIIKPTGLAVGDVMIVNIAVKGGTTSFPSLTGWTIVCNAAYEGSGQNHRGSVLYKVADSTDVAAGSFTFNTGASVSSAAGAIVAFYNVDTAGGVKPDGTSGGPLDFAVGVTTNAPTVSTSATQVSGVTSITNVSVNALVALFVMSFDTTAGTVSGFQTATSPGSLNTGSYTYSTQQTLGAGWATTSTAGSPGTGAGSATLGTAKNWGAILIALKPASNPVPWAGAIATFKKASALALGGSAAANYTLSGLSGTGTINKTNLTVTAVAATKTYDGGTTASGTPTITAGYLQTGDSTPTWTQSFNSKNVLGANASTITPAGVVSDGNSGNNYNYTYATATGTINAKAIDITAVTNTKTADGTTSSTGVPTISPALVGGDTSGFIQTFNTVAAGTGKTLTPSGSASDGNSGNNYSVTFHSVSTGTINPAAASAYKITDAASGIPTAGVGDQLTIKLVDQFGNTETGFSGTKNLTFSGLSNADDGTHPTVTDNSAVAQNVGATTTITFANGVSSVGGLLKAYKAETQTLNVHDDAGTPLSSASTGGASASLTIANVNPVATDLAVTRTAGTRVAVALTSLPNHWSDANHDLITLASVNSMSTNSALVTSNANFILYTNTAPNVTDQISYTISDGHGGTGTGHINLTVTAFVTGQNATFTSIMGNSVTVKFYGIANFIYITQRSTDMNTWVSVHTNTVNSAGQPFTVTDNFSDLGGVAPGAAYYRLEWKP